MAVHRLHCYRLHGSEELDQVRVGAGAHCQTVLRLIATVRRRYLVAEALDQFRNGSRHHQALLDVERFVLGAALRLKDSLLVADVGRAQRLARPVQVLVVPRDLPLSHALVEAVDLDALFTRCSCTRSQAATSAQSPAIESAQATRQLERHRKYMEVQ
jgi:hypothetical protein